MIPFWLMNLSATLFWISYGVSGLGLSTAAGPWYLFLAGALASAVVTFREWDIRWDRVHSIMLGACLVGALFIPMPFGIIFILIACHRKLAGAAVVFAIQGAIIALVPLASSRLHDVSWLSNFLTLPLALGGAETLVEPARFHLHSSGVVHAFTPTLEKLGIWPLLPFVATGLAFGRRWLFLGLVAGFIVLRFAVLSLLYLDSPTIEWFTSPTVFGISLALLTAVLMRFGGRIEPREIYVGSLSRKWSIVAAVASAIFAASLTVALTHREPGDRKLGRILINEHNSNWAWTGEKLTTEKYGEMTVYNYYCLYQHLERHFSKVERNQEPLSPAKLAGFDVLVLKIPTAPYSESEVAAVLDFVIKGGGLWLIGDHSDVFGSNVFLNQIATHFGIKFQPDSVAGLPDGRRQKFTRPRVLAHPTVASIEFATSCSLACSPGVWPTIVGDDIFGDEIDYGIENFVADLRPSAHEPFGSFIQAAAVTYGEGRVAAFTDSTLFSNFFFYTPGISEHALLTIEWLNRASTTFWVPWAVSIVALAGLFCLGILRDSGIPLASGLLVGLAVGIPVSDALSTMPMPQASYPTVGFDYEEPGYNISMGPDDNFHTFFVWMQRLDLIPRECAFDDALKCDIIVELEPQKRWTPDKIHAVKSAVQRGAVLVVLDDPSNERSTADDLLKHFDLSLGPARENVEFRGVTIPRAYGDVLQRKGRVFVFGASRLFGMASMGETSTIPDDYQSRVYQIQFALFKEAFSLRR